MPVGDPGNAADTTGFGSVAYSYNIGEYDVTANQYTAFLNAVASTDTYDLYSSYADRNNFGSYMASTSTGNPGIIQSGLSGSYTYSVAAGRGNYPVTDVTFWDATRFANWLDNGQPTGAEGPGTTETGTYAITPTGILNNTVTRNAGATWAVTSEDEWYKAAYYTPLGGTGNNNSNYWLYPTQSNTISLSQANYYASNSSGPGSGTDTTPVGSYAYPSYYGTYDEGGDVFQWNESVYSNGSYRGLRGGSFSNYDEFLQSSVAYDGNPEGNISDEFGFRVSEVPEPASLGIVGFGMVGLRGAVEGRIFFCRRSTINRKGLKMRSHKMMYVLFLAPALGLLAGAASASITIATVPVGNPGNAPDSTPGFGSVAYSYNIGEYDVTSSQYTAFLNAVAATDTYGVYNSDMAGTTSGNPGIIQSGSSGSYTYSVAAGRGNYPVTDVTFWDTSRFANWLDNGQPNGAEGPGTTETGTYTLTPTGIANNTVTRNANYTWAVTSENEWYKAAYYTPLGGTGNSNPNYWLYPTQSNTISPSQANYTLLDTTPVGSYAYPSYYGTYDQGGDVFQWNESIYRGSFRGLRGGSFDNFYYTLPSNYSLTGDPTDDYSDVGFRVSQVPEPASLGILAFGATGMLIRRRRVRR